MSEENNMVNPAYDENFLKRFWSKVIKSDGCWEWQGATQSKGYGVIGVNGKIKLAHRIAYELYFGVIPAGMCVLHFYCDNRKCVNPDHLCIGTIQDNNRDMVRKGRQAKNIKNGRAKLDWEKVLLIRELYKQGENTYKTLADRFNISKFSVGGIIRGDYWKLPEAE